MTEQERAAAVAVLDAAIAAAAAGPKKVTTDGMSVEQHPIADLIAQRKYLASLTTTATSTTRMGVRFVKLIPGGTE